MTATARLTSRIKNSDMGAWIETQSGPFYLADPTFNIDAIAHALAHIPRFNGHTNQFYSVAEHSIFVAFLMDDLDLGDPLEGLMHDATEAYICDIPSPFKEVMPEYRTIENSMDAAVRKQFDLPVEKTEGCKKADTLALLIEAYLLMPGKAANWNYYKDVREEAIALVNDGYGPIFFDGDFVATRETFKYKFKQLYGNTQLPIKI